MAFNVSKNRQSVFLFSSDKKKSFLFEEYITGNIQEMKQKIHHM